MPAEQKISADEVQTCLVWATELIALEVGVTVDPLAVRQSARAAVEGRTRLSEDEALEALRLVLRDSKLVPAPTLVDVAASLEQTELPLVSLGGGGLALASRRGNELDVVRPDGRREWMSLEAARTLVRKHPASWLTAAPAAPLEDLAGHHHTPWQRLRALIGLERDDLWLVFIYAAAVGVFTLATPIAVQSLVGTVAFGTLLQPIVVLSLLLLVALGFQGALKALQQRVVESIQERVFVRTALDLAWRLPRVKPEAEGFGPESVNRFFDVMTVQKTASVLLTDGISTVLQMAIGLLVLGFYHPALLAFDLVLIVLVAAVVFAPAKRGLDASLDESHAKYEVAGWLQQLARAGTTFRSSSGAALALDRADALTRRYVAARRSHFTVLFGQSIATLVLQGVTSAALLGLGGWLVVQRELTLGQLVAAEIIVAAITASVIRFSKLLDSAYDLLTALEKVGHVLDLPIEAPRESEPLPGTGPVRVDLRDVPLAGRPQSLEVKAGARVAVVTPPGSLLGDWLGGLRLPPQGIVSFNGVETRRARSAELHEHVVVVRDDGVFEGSLLENVVVGRVGITAADVRAVLKRVSLADDVRDLPEGLDTKLDAHGRPLDASQRLRLMLARALVGAPRLVVVDASLEGLAPDVRQAVWAALSRDGAPWTLVMLVNDPTSSTAKACERVITFDGSAS